MGTQLAYCGHQGKQLAEDICNKLALTEHKDAAGIMLGKLVHSKNFIPFFRSIVLRMVSNTTLRKRIALSEIYVNPT